MSGNDDVLRERRECRDALDAQAADLNAGAGGELEVLGDASVEYEAAFGTRRVVETHRIADLVEAFLIERRGGHFRLFPIPRRDVGTPNADLHLGGRAEVTWRIDRNQFEQGAGHGIADDAGTRRLEVAVGRERRGLGRSP